MSLPSDLMYSRLAHLTIPKAEVDDGNFTL